jgi:alpha-beta hydrolase superfamily lysophospholipase
MLPSSTTTDGLTLARVSWPAAGRPRGTLLIVHGLGEHCERYVRLAADLTAAGWLVHSYDQRGHGASEGARGDIATPTSLLDDLALVLDALQEERVPRPLVLLGHSMGGAVAARFVADGAADVDALVLSSPALDPGLTVLQRLRLALGARLMPHVAVSNGLSPKGISRDPQVVRRYIDDTRVHDRITPLLARFIVDAGQRVVAAAPQWRTPTLLLWSGADRCVSPRGSAAFAAATPKPLVRTRCFDGLAHEIFNEPERDLVVGALLDFLRSLPSSVAPR